jgi:hypothetical protein
MTNKQKYIELCKERKDIPIFSQPWWLDAVCQDGIWDVVLVEKGNVIWGALPYYYQKDWKGKRITMPKLTQTMGPWLRYPKDQKYANKISHEKEIMTKLIKELPKFGSFTQNFHYTVTNWLPFHWEGFKQTTRYTYILEDTSQIETLWKQLRSNIRREIKKAKSKNLKTINSSDIEKFYEINSLTFNRQDQKTPYSLEFIKDLDSACVKEKRRKILLAEDKQKRTHAGIYLVWDNKEMYYLMGGGDPELRNSGATSLLMWEAIKLASKKGLKFNFEGSMIEPVERFFRAFGAIQTPYFQIYKRNSLPYRLMDCAKILLK